MRLILRALSFLTMCALNALIIAVVVSNRSLTEISLYPLPYELRLPLFAVMGACFVLGLVTGIILYLGLRLRTAHEHYRLKRQISALSASK
jgi:branched-subunit amino acid transport protein